MGVEMNIEGKKVLIVGTGKSGIAAALLSQVGGGACPFDENEGTDKREVEKKLPEGCRRRLLRESFRIRLRMRRSFWCSALVFRVDTPFVEKFRDKGVRVWGEVELGYAFPGVR